MDEFEATLMAGHPEDAVEAPFDDLPEWGVRPQKISGRTGHDVLAAINGYQF